MTNAASQIAKGQISTPMKVKSNDEFGLLAQSFNNMLNNVQTKTAELIYERNRSKMILAQLPDGIIVTDLNISRWQTAPLKPCWVFRLIQPRVKF